MNIFMDMWLTWAIAFKGLPYGEYVAAFVLIGLLAYGFKVIKNLVDYVW